jgi:hypothetical protein
LYSRRDNPRLGNKLLIRRFKANRARIGKAGFLLSLFALALHSYENTIPETIKAIKKELTQSSEKKPKLLGSSGVKEIEG